MKEERSQQFSHQKSFTFQEGYQRSRDKHRKGFLVGYCCFLCPTTPAKAPTLWTPSQQPVQDLPWGSDATPGVVRHRLFTQEPPRQGERGMPNSSSAEHCFTARPLVTALHWETCQWVSEDFFFFAPLFFSFLFLHNQVPGKLKWLRKRWWHTAAEQAA